MSNNNNKLFNDLRKTESLQQPLIDSNRITFNPLQKNINPNNYQGGKKITNNQPQKERYTMASPFPPDSLFDLKSTNSVMGFIPPEPKNKFIQNVQNVKAKKINSQRIISSNKRLNYNTIDANNISEKINKIKKGPIDDASNNSSNNKIIQTKSPLNLNKDTPNNLKKKFLEKDNYNNNNNASLNNNNKNNTFNYSFNNNTLKNKNILLNNSPYNNNIKSKIFNTQSQNNFNNNKNIKNNIINQNNNNSNSNNNNSIISNSVKRTNLQNQFINRNIAMTSMLNRIQFFEKMNKIGEERMKLFEKEFQKDTFFMKKDFFDNIFINESEIDKLSPLTLIFHYIFNPETEITQYSFKKCFFESIFKLRGDKDIKLNYSPNDLKQVPKYFNDFNYVNNLFNNFNENDLINFLNEIENWKKTFSFELQFVHPLKNNNIGQNQIEINDVAKVYFVSPNDLIVDYHTYAENFPLSDSFVSISQYNFHCDIKFDQNQGRFAFKTSAIVYNKLQIVNENIIQNLIKKEANNTNGVELLVHTWKPLLNIIREESKKNRMASDQIFKQYLRRELNKYSIHKQNKNSEEEKNITELNNENNLNNNNINIINQNNNNNYININNKKIINENILEDKSKNIQLKNINKNIENKITNINDNINSNIIKENNITQNKINMNYKTIDNNMGHNFIDRMDRTEGELGQIRKKDEIKNINNINVVKEEKNVFLFYGVLITFFLFLFKTILSIENGNISSETFFNILIIFVIGFMLIKTHILDSNQQR